jgi:hypothetical protein
MLCDHGRSGRQCGAKLLGALAGAGNPRFAGPLGGGAGSRWCCAPSSLGETCGTQNPCGEFKSYKQISHVAPPIPTVSLHGIHTAANLLVVHINAVSNAPMRARCSEFGRVSFGVEQPCRPAEAEAGSLSTLTIGTNRDFGCRLLSPCRGGHERSAGPGLLGTFLFHKLLTTCQTSGTVKNILYVQYCYSRDIIVM